MPHVLRVKLCKITREKGAGCHGQGLWIMHAYAYLFLDRTVYAALQVCGYLNVLDVNELCI